MALILFKWLFVVCLTSWNGSSSHPIFVSVTEIEHNAKDRTLEVSCKIFTDDFEQALRKSSKEKVDLLNPMQKSTMDALVNNYIQKHLRVRVNRAEVKLKFVGYEESEEAIITYFEANNIPSAKEVIVTNNILYEDKPQQLSLLHVTVNGTRKSTKLNNPEELAVFSF